MKIWSFHVISYTESVSGNLGFSKQDIRAMQQWNISSYFINRISKQKSWSFLSKPFKKWIFEFIMLFRRPNRLA